MASNCALFFSAAHKVNLRDDSFTPDNFEVVIGFLDVTWQRLAPGSNVSHVVILRPLKAGYFNFTAAEVSYFPKEDSTEAQVSFKIRLQARFGCRVGVTECFGLV